MFFRKKNEEEEKPKAVKKVYNFEEDKSEKINISALFDKTISNNVDNKKVESSTEEVSEEAPKEKKSKLVVKEAVIDIPIEDEDSQDFETEEVDDDVESEEELEDYEQRKLFLKKLFKTIFFTLLVAFIIIFIWALNSSTFLVSQVNVNYTKSAQDISGDTTLIQQLNQSISQKSSYVIGNSILLIDVPQLKAEIEKIPYVYKADIIRSFPSSVIIKYSVRTPYIQLYSNNTYKIVDKYAVVIDVKNTAEEGLPIVWGIYNSDYHSGDFIFGIDEVKYKNIVLLNETAKKLDFEHEIRSFSYEDSDNLKFYIGDAQVDVEYGAVEDDKINEKLLFLKAIINRAIEDNIHGTLDISSENYYKSVLKRE